MPYHITKKQKRNITKVNKVVEIIVEVNHLKNKIKNSPLKITKKVINKNN